MANLTKRDMVVAISDDVGINQQQTFAVIQKTLEHITESLAQGDNVELRNFGVFEVRLTKARVGRNPNKPETDVVIPARATVKFKPGKIMRQRVLLRTDKLSKQNGAKTQK
jgi:nucleoid DNA-binding protein